MMEKINWTLNVAVAGGPKISSADTLEVEAYDKVGVYIPAGSKVETEVQPGDKGEVKFLLISADHYGGKLIYRINDESGDEITLDALQLFIGTGAVSVLGKPPQIFHFENQMDRDVTIDILVGREANTGEAEDIPDETGSSDTPITPDDSGSPDPSNDTGSESNPEPGNSGGAEAGGESG